MENRLLFGTAYYPEYMPYERTDQDIAMMKAAGMNTVRIAESTWSTLEPAEGIFDFSYIDRVLEKTEKAGMLVIVGTPTYAVPAWLVRKDPDIMAETSEGREKYGHRQIFDLLNPTFRKHAEIVIRKLAAHTAGHKNVTGFQIDNETKHYDNMGRRMQAGFRQYLKEKFVTTERLNEAFGLAYWSNSIHDWEDFPDMRGCINGGLMAEFEKYRRKIAADYLAWQAQIIREYKREDQFITHNLDFEWKKFGADIAQDGYSYGVQPDISHYEASKCLTLSGTDIYHPTQDELTGAEIAFGGDSIRSLKDDNYLVLECQAQAFKYWTPYPGQLRLHAYSHLASGAGGLLYWNWHSIHSGYETYWKGILSHDMGTNPAYEEVCRTGQEWKRIGAALCSMKKDNRTALVVDNHSLSAFKWFPIDKDLTYNDVVRWMYDSLYEMNIECDIVDINALEPDRYDMIVTPALYCVSAPEKQQIIGYPKRIWRGGTDRGCIEAPHLTKHDGWYYIMCAEGGTGYNHCVTMGRSRNVWGPYEKDPENPILTSAPGVSYEREDPDHLKPKYYNPDSILQKSGHGSYVETPDGEVYLFYHTARPFVPELRCTLGRETAVQKMRWTEDGWLRMDEGNLARVETVESSLPECPMPKIPDFDDFDSGELGNWYYAPRIMPQSFADVKARPGYVRIRGQEARTSLNRVSILARKLTSVYARITTKMEFEPEVYQHSAGLIIYYDNMNYVNLRKYYSETLGGPALSVVQLENGRKTEYNDWRVPAPEGAVWMRLYVEGRKTWFEWSADGKDYRKTGPDFDFFEYIADETKGVE